MAAAATAAATTDLLRYPTAVTSPIDKWLLKKGLIEYFDQIYPLLIKFFTDLTHLLENSEARPLQMIAVGSFAKHLYDMTLHFADFDFQVYEKDAGANYLSDSYRRYVSEVITPEWETDIKKYLSKIILRFISDVNEVNKLYLKLPFTLITNNIDTSTPPGPLKISIQYEGGHETSPIKIVDINYSRRNVLAYNDIGLKILDKFRGNIPTVLYPIKRDPSQESIVDLIRTLQPCVFYEEKQVLADMKDTGIPEEKIKNDLEFWEDQCKKFEITHKTTYIPTRGRKGRTGKTGKKIKSQKYKTRKNHKRSKSGKN